MPDMLSGYRVFSRRFVKSFPLTAEGFAIETELTVHAVRLMMPLSEMETRYKERPAGSVSKLNTYADGLRHPGLHRLSGARGTAAGVLFRPSPSCSFLVALAIGAPVVSQYMHTGQVPRLPTAVLATGLMVIASLSSACGLILDNVSRSRWEAKRMAYLAIPGRWTSNDAPRQGPPAGIFWHGTALSASPLSAAAAMS